MSCRILEHCKALALLLALTVSTACGRGEEAPSCVVGVPVRVDLEEWLKRVKAVPGWPIDDWETAVLDDAPDYARTLAAMGFEPLPAGTDYGTPERDVMGPVTVEIAEVRRGGGKRPDKLVAARFRNGWGAESLRAAVLRPQPGQEDAYCFLGEDLSQDKEKGEEPCLSTHTGPARTLGLEPLVAPDRDAIVVHDAEGSCGYGTDRGDRFATAYWGIEEGHLVRYFEGVTFESWYVSPMPPTSETTGKIELSDSWPRTLTYTENRICYRDDDESSGPGDDCEDFERITTYRYLNHRYVATAEPP